MRYRARLGMFFAFPLLFTTSGVLAQTPAEDVDPALAKIRKLVADTKQRCNDVGGTWSTSPEGSGCLKAGKRSGIWFSDTSAPRAWRQT